MNLRILILSLALSVSAQDLELDKTDWIDPTDMLYYDTVKRVMKKPVQERTQTKHSGGDNTDRHEKRDSCSEAENQKCEKLKFKLEECEQNIVKLKHGEDTFTYRDEMPFMKRYVSQLIDHFSVDTSVTQDYKVEVYLTSEDRIMLKKFVAGDTDKLHIVDEILTNIIVNSSPILTLDTDWTAAINLEFLAVAIILCGLWSFMLKASVFKSALFFVVISTFWHWKRMYQEAVAHREAELAKLVNIPSECVPNESQGLFYKFGSLLIQKMFGKDADACEKYHKAAGVDPIWQVSPSVALSETVAQFVTQPLGVLGSNIGTFYYNLNENLPWCSFYIIMFATLAFAFFALVATFKYRIRLPFGIVSIEPAPAAGQIPTSPPAPALAQPPQVRQAIEEISSQSELGQSDPKGTPALNSLSTCKSCQCSVKSIQAKQADDLVFYAGGGAGDQKSPAQRENMQEIKEQCLNDDKTCHAPNITPLVNKEGGDTSDTPVNQFSPNSSASSTHNQLSPNGSKFLSDLYTTLQQ